MAVDAFDPGPGGTYPWFPRDSAGRPAWSDSPATDGQPADNGSFRMPRGLRRDGDRWIDLTPRKPDGAPIDPPTIPPAG